MKPFCIALLALAATWSFAQTPADKGNIVLFDGKSLGDWEKVDIGGSGEVSVENGELIIAQGDSVSGAVYKKAKDLPLQNYELTLEAMRVEGSDFFVGLTFPVGDLKTCLTLIMGGWGGALVGISSIDGMDASENNTSSVQKFADNTWYKVKLQVTPKDIHVWLDGKEVINTEIEGHKLGVRPGPIESYLPLSFTTYQTRAAIKNVKITKIPAAK
jgi:hypothetical protein